MIELINNETINLKKLEMTDIIELSVLQKFLDNFALGMNCAAVAVDRNGKEVTRPSYYREFCSNFIHSTTEGDNRCAECHNQMGELAAQSGKPYTGRCHAGLIDFASPITINGELLGTVLGGQILDKSPVEAEIRHVAGELGLSSDQLWEAARKIDIVHDTNIHAAAEVLFVVVNALADNGYHSLETSILTDNLTVNFSQISSTVEMLAESAQSIATNQHQLTRKISSVKTVTMEISEILKSISSIAKRTKMIGLNASIESSRLGENGKSYAVVADEIQNLAQQSKLTVSSITELNSQINQRIASTIQDADSTLNNTEEQSAAMEELSATVQSSLVLAERLRTLFSAK